MVKRSPSTHLLESGQPTPPIVIEEAEMAATPLRSRPPRKAREAPKQAGPRRARQAAPLHAGAATSNIRVVQHGGLTWVDIKHPGRDEIAWLQAHFPDFHPLHLNDVASIRQHAKLDERADYLFMVMHFPLFTPATRIITPSEVDFFI